jgi:hypothetical protein
VEQPRGLSGVVVEALAGAALLQGVVGLCCVVMGAYMVTTGSNRTHAVAVLMVAGVLIIAVNVGAFGQVRKCADCGGGGSVADAPCSNAGRHLHAVTLC